MSFDTRAEEVTALLQQRFDPSPLPEPFRLTVVEGDALERHHPVADGGEHAPHLALAALADRDLEHPGPRLADARGGGAWRAPCSPGSPWGPC